MVELDGRGNAGKLVPVSAARRGELDGPPVALQPVAVNPKFLPTRSVPSFMVVTPAPRKSRGTVRLPPVIARVPETVRSRPTTTVPAPMRTIFDRDIGVAGWTGQRARRSIHGGACIDREAGDRDRVGRDEDREVGPRGLDRRRGPTTTSAVYTRAMGAPPEHVAVFEVVQLPFATAPVPSWCSRSRARTCPPRRCSYAVGPPPPTGAAPAGCTESLKVSSAARARLSRPLPPPPPTTGSALRASRPTIVPFEASGELALSAPPRRPPPRPTRRYR